MAEPLDVDLDAWEAWRPWEVSHRLRGVATTWYVIAGWAIDLFLGQQTRDHDDLEIGVPTHGFGEVRAALADLDLVVVGDGRAWPLEEATLAAHFQTWAREPEGPWRLDVVREHWEADEWIYRRDERIRVHASRAIALTKDGVPYLAPELVLLFKAKATRPKDDVDFGSVLPRLEATQRSWLRETLTVTHPGHRWIDPL